MEAPIGILTATGRGVPQREGGTRRCLRRSNLLGLMRTIVHLPRPPALRTAAGTSGAMSLDGRLADAAPPPARVVGELGQPIRVCHLITGLDFGGAERNLVSV